MTPEQVELLFKASQSPMISAEQRAKLSVANPWSMKGAVAEVIQREVARLNPQQAKAWIAEAGATMSLEAAAARQGLMPMTDALRMELERMNPQTEDEARQARIDELTRDGNPYGQAGYYQGEEFVAPVQGNLTKAMMLEELDPALAARLKQQAQPAKAAHDFTPREQQILMQHGYALPTAEA